MNYRVFLLWKYSPAATPSDHIQYYSICGNMSRLYNRYNGPSSSNIKGGFLHRRSLQFNSPRNSRFFVLVLKRQFAKFPHKFDPTQIIKCLQAYHVAILYIYISALCAPNLTKLMKATIWSLLLVEKLDSLTKIVTLTA